MSVGQPAYQKASLFEAGFQQKFDSSAFGSVGSFAISQFGESAPEPIANKIDLALGVYSLMNGEKISQIGEGLVIVANGAASMIESQANSIMSSHNSAPTWRRTLQK